MTEGPLFNPCYSGKKICKWSEMISDHFFSESNFLAKFHGAIDSRTSFGM